MRPAFSKKSFLVTGASSGIGRAVTESLLAGGAKVTCIARDLSAAAPAENFRRWEMDLGDLKKLPQNLAALQKQCAGLDGAVLCAGAGRFGSLEEFSYGQISALLDLNLTSQIYLTRALLPALKQNRAHLVFIGSESALAGAPRGAVYCAAKFGLRGFAQSLRRECAAAGMRVTIVNPGMVRTRFFDGLSFAPGFEADNALTAGEVAAAIVHALSVDGGVVDEINLSPLKKVVARKPPPSP